MKSLGPMIFNRSIENLNLIVNKTTKMTGGKKNVMTMCSDVMQSGHEGLGSPRVTAGTPPGTFQCLFLLKCRHAITQFTVLTTKVKNII